jgi:CubicO group peptidase (beta-lactamase class C family)
VPHENPALGRPSSGRALPTDRAAPLEARLQGWVKERDLSGTVLLSGADGVLFEGWYGLADRAAGVPVTASTRFGLASVTKLFTAVAVTDLAGAGRLGFQSAVVDILPPGRRPSTLRADVTVHHLLTHTSGIADYFEEEAEDGSETDADYGDLWAERPVYRMERAADFLPLFGDLPPYRPPGQRWQYSNAGYILLGLVVEEVTGRPFAEVVQERVFDRAGMAASGFFRLDEARPDVAIGYLPRRTPDELWRTNVYRVPVVGGSDGGAFSTAADLDHFLTRLADGTLLGDGTATMLAHHVDAEDGFSFGYGIRHYPDGRYGHGGGDPGVEVLVHRFPADDVNLVVLTNGEGMAGDVRDALLAAWRG